MLEIRVPQDPVELDVSEFAGVGAENNVMHSRSHAIDIDRGTVPVTGTIQLRFPDETLRHSQNCYKSRDIVRQRRLSAIHGNLARQNWHFAAIIA